MRLASAPFASLVFSLGTQQFAQGFVTPVPKSELYLLKAVADDSPVDHQNQVGVISSARRAVLSSAALATGSLMLGGALPEAANAAVGTLPEFSDTNAILQGLTVNVADKPQQEAMIDFLVNGFDFKVMRKRIKDSVEETWLGFGPEQVNIPEGFELPVSSFSQYGGHASINVRYDSQSTALLYRQGDNAPGDNIAFLQVGVPTYRISQMVAAGGNIIDAYGLVNVIAPCGLPMRGIVGISPDPIMFVAINCKKVKESVAYYQQLGFVEQEYPFSRPSKGTTMFEPDKPRNAVYMAPSPNCMGVLLLPSKAKKITPNPIVDSLNIVYTPTEGAFGSETTMLKDLSGLPIRFQSVADFVAEEKKTQ